MGFSPQKNAAVAATYILLDDDVLKPVLHTLTEENLK
jgi:hypothetical protein